MEDAGSKMIWDGSNEIVHSFVGVLVLVLLHILVYISHTRVSVE